MDLYLVSTEDFEIVCCILDFQETKEFPMKLQKLLIDLLLSGYEA